MLANIQHVHSFSLWKILNMTYIVWLITITTEKLHFIVSFKLHRGTGTLRSYIDVYFIQVTLIYFLPKILSGNLSKHTEES